MTILTKLWTKLADRFYSQPPERNEQGNPITNVKIDYWKDENILFIKVERRCVLRIEDVNEQAFEHFMDFKYKTVNWLNVKEAANICLWFKVRQCNTLIRNIEGNWYEKKISDSYVTSLIDIVSDECARQGMI